MKWYPDIRVHCAMMGQLSKRKVWLGEELRTWGGPEWPRPCFLGFPLGRKPGCWLTRVSPSCVLGTEARPGWGKAHWKVTIGTMHTCTWRSRKRRESNIRQSGTFAMPQKMVVAAWLINGNARVHWSLFSSNANNLNSKFHDDSGVPTSGFAC